MVVVNHLIEQMYDVIEALNTDIDRLVAERDRVKAAVLALTPGAPVAPMPIKPTAGERALASPSPKPRAKKAAARKRRNRGPKDADYAEIAKAIVAARRDGLPVNATLAEHFGVPLSTARNWPGRCRELGLLGDPDAITPSQIRHEVEPIPADQKLTLDNPIEHIADSTNMHSLGFATRPTHVEHPPVETERNGWRPGMAAAMAVSDGDDG